LAKEAAVTSGALYGHFASKEDAFKETLAAGIYELCAGITALQTEHGPKWLEAFVDCYLGYKRVCDLGDSCTMQSLTSEVQRADADTKGVQKMTSGRLAPGAVSCTTESDQARSGRADIAEELVDVGAQVYRLLAQLIGRSQHLI